MTSSLGVIGFRVQCSRVPAKQGLSLYQNHWEENCAANENHSSEKQPYITVVVLIFQLSHLKNVEEKTYIIEL